MKAEETMMNFNSERGPFWGELMIADHFPQTVDICQFWV